jgi:hypothetical protein
LTSFPPLLGLTWEPCGQIDLGLPSKGSSIVNLIPESFSDPTIVNLVSLDPSVYPVKVLFESSLDAFSAFCGDACFPVLYDYGSAITLHPRSFREMLLRKGFRAKQVGSRKVSTIGFTGSPLTDTVAIYELELRLWQNSVPAKVLSYEFQDHQTNLKTLLFGRVDIWAHDWFPGRDENGTPVLKTPRGSKPLMRAKSHLLRPLPSDFTPPAAYQRPDQPVDPEVSYPTTNSPAPSPVRTISETGGWSLPGRSRPPQKGLFGQQANFSLSA